MKAHVQLYAGILNTNLCLSCYVWELLIILKEEIIFVERRSAVASEALALAEQVK